MIQQPRHRFAESGRLEDHPRSRRPRVTTRRQDRQIWISRLWDRFHPKSLIAALNKRKYRHPISPATVYQTGDWLADVLSKALSCPTLSTSIISDGSGSMHLWWTFKHWDGVSDKSRFWVSVADGWCHVWRRRGERQAHCCILEFNRWDGGSVMVLA